MTSYIGFVDTTKVPIGYSNYIWANKGCVNAIKFCIDNNLKYEILPNVWETKGAVEDGMCYLEKVKLNLLEIITKDLNAYHQENSSIKQWIIVLGSWLDIYLVSLYDKYLKLKNMCDIAFNLDCELLDTSKFPIIRDYEEYYEMLWNGDDLHLYLYSLLINEMRIDLCRNIGNNKIILPQNIIEKQKIQWKSLALQAILNTLNYISRNNIETVIKGSYLPTKLLIEISRKSRYKSMFYCYSSKMHRKFMSGCVDMQWRTENKIYDGFDDEFSKLAYKLVRKTMPAAYLEDYQTLAKVSDKIYYNARKATDIYYSCEQVESDELFKLFLKRKKDSDNHFYCIQHGGDYGIEKNMISGHEYMTCDTFITWGWKAENIYGCDFKSMPASKLLNMKEYEKNRKKSNREGRNILYVSYTFPRNLTRLRDSEARYENDREEELLFLGRLSEQVSDKMIVRPYTTDYGWNTADNMRRVNSYIQVDNDCSYYEALYGTKLVAAFHWSTTAIEALHNDIPIIVRKNSNSIEPFAKKDYDAMVEVGIIVSTFDKLAETLNAIYDNIERWWNEEKRKEVVKRIRDKYAYVPENSEEIWINEINKKYR